MITRVLGAEAEVQVDTFSLEAQPGDVVLLCTDGLTDMVPEQDIAGLPSRTPTERGRHRPPAGARGARGRRRGQRHRGRLPLRRGRARGRRRGRHVEQRRPTRADRRPRRGPRPRDSAAAEPLAQRPAAGRIGASAVVLVVRSWRSPARSACAASHFVGADDVDRPVAIYQGVPIDLFVGINLYHVVYESRTSAYASLDRPASARSCSTTRSAPTRARTSVRRPDEVASP